MTVSHIEYFDCTDLAELEDNAKNVLRIALKAIDSLPVSQVPLVNLVQIDELQKKIAAYRLEIKRRCSTVANGIAPQSDAQLFISYASADSATAQGLANSLQARGIPVFFAPASIRSADSYVDSLNRGLAGCRSAVILWSGSASESTWVKNEMNFLTIRRNRGDLLLEIVRLEPVEVPPLLQDLQRRDAFGRDVDDVARDIAADLSR